MDLGVAGRYLDKLLRALKCQKSFIMCMFVECCAVYLGGSWWILTWILVDLDVDLGGSWWILKRFLVDLGRSRRGSWRMLTVLGSVFYRHLGLYVT